ncbi:MAG: DNA-binding response regulator [Bacteroidetes bacterium]|nr:MAG: DNA-binding response regulator [Bacteroidota bacterium]
MIKVIAIDDEMHCLGALQILLKEHCPEVELLATFQSAERAIDHLATLKPDIVFLDIEMPGMNGFEFLVRFSEIPFSVIFTTGHEQYAIRAIRMSALDYLLKPLDPHDLALAVQKIKNQPYKNISDQFKLLIEQMHHKDMIKQIAVPTKEGFDMIFVDDIVKCEAYDNYVKIYLKNKKHIIVCRTLKETEQLLKSFDLFARVHNSYLVNLNEVARYIRGEGGYLVMHDGSTVDVSKSRKEFLLKKIWPSHR